MIDWNNLSDIERTQITSSSLDLLRTLTTIVGSQHGLETWERITEVMGDDAKAAIFFSMLIGPSGNVVRVSKYPTARKIEFIKIIRNYNGLGLLEAKNLSEQLDGPYPKPYVEIRVQAPERYQSCRQDLIAIGAALA